MRVPGRVVIVIVTRIRTGTTGKARIGANIIRATGTERSAKKTKRTTGRTMSIPRFITKCGKASVPVAGDCSMLLMLSSLLRLKSSLASSRRLLTAS